MKTCSHCRKAPRRSAGQRYCAACHAKWQRANPAVKRKLEAVARRVENERDATLARISPTNAANAALRAAFDCSIDIIRGAKTR